MRIKIRWHFNYLALGLIISWDKFKGVSIALLFVNIDIGNLKLDKDILKDK